MQNLRAILRLIIIIAALAGLGGAALRYRTEVKNRRVEIALDMTEVQKLAAAEGKSLAATLQACKEAGATSIALNEDTLKSLEESRKIEIISTARLSETYMMAHQGNFQRIAAALKHRTKLSVQVPPGLEGTRPMDAGIDIDQPYNLIDTQPVGLDPALVAAIKQSHLNVVARLENSHNITEEGIGWTLDQLKADGVSTVFFAGEEILGYDGRLKATAKALRSRELNYGALEFVKIKGDEALQRLVPDRTVRVHVIPAAEMANATPADNVQRFSLAARERNMRLLFVRLFLSKSDPLQENTRYLQSLKRALLRGGLSVDPSRPARPFESLTSPLWLRVLIGLGLAAALLLLADQIFGVLGTPSGKAFWGVVAVAAVLWILAWLPLGRTPVKLAALAAACLFPSLAIMQKNLFDAVPWGERLWPTVWRRLFSVLGITVLGIAHQIGLLADRVFLVKADAFLGIKLALYLPLVLAVLVWVLDLRAESAHEWRTKAIAVAKRAATLFDNPLRLGQIVVSLAVIAVLGLLWLRSGNEGAAAVSGLELRFRELLDQYLLVRPRFKANLFAAFLIGLYLAARGQTKLSIPFFLLGLIAVTDFHNTFCHLHTPLLVSAMRDVLGLLLGAGIGVLLIFVGEKWASRTPAPAPAPEPEA